MDLSAEQIEQHLEVNLRSAIYIIQALAQHMVSRKAVHIIVTVSLGGILGLKGSAVYSATKFGLRGLLMSLRDELVPHGVAVSGIYPQGVKTPMLLEEAKAGGSALNFLNAPLSVDVVVDHIMRTIRS